MSERVVGVLPDVPAIDKVFDYTVPPSMEADVRVGTIVRVVLHGRRVGGWVVDDDRPAVAGRALRPLAKVTGWGPPPEVVELATWAAWRWAGRRASLLASASPVGAVRALPVAALPVVHGAGAPASGAIASGAVVPTTTAVDPEVAELAAAALAPVDLPTSEATRLGDPPGEARPGDGRRRVGPPVRILRLPPAADTFGVVLAAAALGSALVLYPDTADAGAAALRLGRAGVEVALYPRDWARARAGGVTVVGARAAAWAPLPDLAAVVVVDGHDEGYQGGAAPTWHGRDVAVERARRAGVPAVVVSPCPDLSMTEGATVTTASRSGERAGWPVLDVVDRRADDPRTGLFSERLADALRRHDRVLCVLNRKGRARLLACAACGELSRCERCAAAVVLVERELHCTRCGAERPPLCLACGASRLKALRLGVTRVRDELAALTGREVAEVTGDTPELPDAPVLVGTEAVLHRAGRADLVAFLDFDQELVAPRYRAGEEALALLARAGRAVGGRRGGGRVLVQTRLPHHEVLDAALHGDPGRLAAAEAPRRRALGFPPYAALALVSGAAAPALVERLRDGRAEAGRAAALAVLGPDDGRWLLRSPDHVRLCDALADAGRPPGRLRIEVDPLRV